MNFYSLEVYNRAIQRALNEIYNLDLSHAEEMIEIVFPVWRQAVHEILLHQGAGFRSSDDADSFLQLSPGDQIGLVSVHNIYSFPYFVHVIETGRINFYDQILASQCQTINA